jgi:hypothetical protein
MCVLASAFFASVCSICVTILCVCARGAPRGPLPSLFMRLPPASMMTRYKKMMDDAGVRHGETHQLRGVDVSGPGRDVCAPTPPPDRALQHTPRPRVGARSDQKLCGKHRGTFALRWLVAARAIPIVVVPRGTHARVSARAQVCDNLVLAMRGAGWDGGEDDADEKEDEVWGRHTSCARVGMDNVCARATATQEAGPIAMGSVSDWCVRHVLANVVVVKT